jgi:hypothetical protein
MQDGRASVSNITRDGDPAVRRLKGNYGSVFRKTFVPTLRCACAFFHPWDDLDLSRIDDTQFRLVRHR